MHSRRMTGATKSQFLCTFGISHTCKPTPFRHPATAFKPMLPPVRWLSVAAAMASTAPLLKRRGRQKLEEQWVQVREGTTPRGQEGEAEQALPPELLPAKATLDRRSTCIFHSIHAASD
jgi:hypothetical protein